MSEQSGRRSRCTEPKGAPYTWADYCDGVELTVENELEELMQEGCATYNEFTLRMGLINARRKRAAAGELTTEDNFCEIKPIRDEPEVWEIRWCIDERPFRLYHAEPAGTPSLLLGLRYHWKVTRDGNGDELSADRIDDLQDVEIASAVSRFTRWSR